MSLGIQELNWNLAVTSFSAQLWMGIWRQSDPTFKKQGTYLTKRISVFSNIKDISDEPAGGIYYLFVGTLWLLGCIMRLCR